ncbi:MAG: M67 family metallopeptidase [Parasphingorhabdus sp.]|uniref:M67 family metallopeptidase n=1 Tax=Parasphingorhabdus sp. TaxID=2709688 RepID=UPI0032983464
MKLVISSKILDELQELARLSAPNEICGLLFGQNRTISEFLASANVAADTEKYFEIDPSTLIAAERRMRGGGIPIMGYYHSHPSGGIEPSRTDALSAAPDGRLWLIINGQSAAAWCACSDGEFYGRFDRITLDCIRTNGQTAVE